MKEQLITTSNSKHQMHLHNRKFQRFYEGRWYLGDAEKLPSLFSSYENSIFADIAGVVKIPEIHSLLTTPTRIKMKKSHISYLCIIELPSLFSSQENTISFGMPGVPKSLKYTRCWQRQREIKWKFSYFLLVYYWDKVMITSSFNFSYWYDGSFVLN